MSTLNCLNILESSMCTCSNEGISDKVLHHPRLKGPVLIKGYFVEQLPQLIWNTRNYNRCSFTMHHQNRFYWTCSASIFWRILARLILYWDGRLKERFMSRVTWPLVPNSSVYVLEYTLKFKQLKLHWYVTIIYERENRDIKMQLMGS